MNQTRSELLKTKQRKKTAIKGHSLLKKKRDALIRKFFELIKNYKELKIKTIEKLNQSYKVLHKAQGVSGVNRLKSLSFSSEKSMTLKLTKTNMMGVEIPKFELLKNEHSMNASKIGLSYYVEDARNKFLDLLPDIIKLSEIEQVIYALAEEIKKTKRRVNALEYIKIPELEKIEKTIKERLAEIERESFVRLKNIKKQDE